MTEEAINVMASGITKHCMRLEKRGIAVQQDSTGRLAAADM